MEESREVCMSDGDEEVDKFLLDNDDKKFFAIFFQRLMIY